MNILSNDGVHPHTGRKAYALPSDRSLVNLRPQPWIREAQGPENFNTLGGTILVQRASEETLSVLALALSKYPWCYLR